MSQERDPKLQLLGIATTDIELENGGPDREPYVMDVVGWNLTRSELRTLVIEEYEALPE